MMNTVNESEFEYVGFWARLGASIIDTVLVVVICFPLLTLIYGKEYWSSTQLVQGPADLLLNWVLPAVAVVLFWVYRQATPGKIVSMLPLMLGFIWVAFDARKQGWHDKLANTVVVRTTRRTP